MYKAAEKPMHFFVNVCIYKATEKPPPIYINYIYIHTHTHTHSHTHTHTHTHVYVYIYIYTKALEKPLHFFVNVYRTVLAIFHLI